MDRQLTFRKAPVYHLLPLGLVVALTPSTLPAQMHHVDTPERVTRALGVYEWTGDLDKPTAARFVPVSLCINGTMQDAGLYLARPVPFALQTGDVYALERAGEPQGLLDLDYAQRVVTNQAMKDDDPEGAWYGFGKFTPPPPEKVANLQPSKQISVLQTDGKPTKDAEEDRPSLTRRVNGTPPKATGKEDGAGADGKPETTNSTSTTDTSKTSETGKSSPAQSDDDTDRPTLRHRDPSQDATRRREYGKSSKQASVTAVGPTPGDDPDRPTLGRNTEADTVTPPLTGLPAGMHQAVGVSDPVHRDQHNFARDWDTSSERASVLASLESVARARVMAYLVANSLVPSSAPLFREPEPAAPARATLPASAAPERDLDTDTDATPPKLQRGIPSQYGAAKNSGTAAEATPMATPAAVPAKALPRSAVAAPVRAAPVRAVARRPTRAGATDKARLDLVQSSLSGYTLSYGGLPTFVYTAAASVALSKSTVVPLRLSPAPLTAGVAPPTPAALSNHPVVFVTVVAQRLPSGELQVALSSVTDSLHQDRSPQLRLVDAVDPDDSHRASLLFELRGATSRQFALYRLTAAQAEQTFTTASIE